MRMCAGDKRLLPVVDEVYTTRTLYRRLPAAWQSGSRKKERKDAKEREGTSIDPSMAARALKRE